MKKQKLNNKEIKQKNEKGITLIALIITIVVLLILASVTIGAIKDSKIITHAQDIKTTYTEAEINEKIQLAISEAYLTGKGTIDETTLKETLKTQLGEDVTLTGSNSVGFVITTSTGKQYSISSSGDISEYEYEEQLERIYYVVGGQWADNYASSENDVLEEATITAKFYKTNMPIYIDLKDLFGDEAPTVNGYGYKLIIEGEGSMPPLSEEGSDGPFYAWLKDFNEEYDEVGFNSFISLTTTAQIIGVSNIGACSFMESFGLTSVVLDESVKSIDDYAFASCISLQNINLENIVSIGKGALTTGYSLKEIKLGEALNTIKDNALCANYNITKIEIPSSVTTVGEEIFSGCENLTDIYVVGKTEDNLPETWSANWRENAPENVTVHWNESMPK